MISYTGYYCHTEGRVISYTGCYCHTEGRVISYTGCYCHNEGRVIRSVDLQVTRAPFCRFAGYQSSIL